MRKKRKIAHELIEGLRAIKSGHGIENTQTPPTGVRLIRARMGLTQKDFAARLNISLRTLQQWEQGISKPSGAATALLDIAYDHPKLFLKRDPNKHTPRPWL